MNAQTNPDARLRTVRVVNLKDPTGGFMIINEDEFVKDQNSKHPKHRLHPSHEASDEAVRDRAAPPLTHGKNTSGTYSQPTPTDIRYPDTSATEFENNHGAFEGADAASMRSDLGMEDKPGGIKPHVHEAVQRAGAAMAEAQAAVTDADRPVRKARKVRKSRRRKAAAPKKQAEAEPEQS